VRPSPVNAPEWGVLGGGNAIKQLDNALRKSVCLGLPLASW